MVTGLFVMSALAHYFNNGVEVIASFYQKLYPKITVAKKGHTCKLKCCCKLKIVHAN